MAIFLTLFSPTVSELQSYVFITVMVIAVMALNWTACLENISTNDANSDKICGISLSVVFRSIRRQSVS